MFLYMHCKASFPNYILLYGVLCTLIFAKLFDAAEGAVDFI